MNIIFKSFKIPLLLLGQIVLVSWYPALFLFYSNPGITNIQELIVILLICGGSAAIFFFFFSYVFKSYEKGAASFLILFIIFFYSPDFFHFITRFKIGGMRIRAFAILILLFFVVLLLFVWLLKLAHKRLHFVRGIIFVVSMLSIYCLGRTFLARIQINKMMGFALEKRKIQQRKTLSFSNQMADRPNIFYIILDMHTSREQIIKNCGYDNNNFIRFLRKKNFFVAENSYSNYPYTLCSIPSSLNMDYLDVQSCSNKLLIDGFLAKLFKNYAVIDLLRKRGYRSVHIPSSLALSGDSYADEEYPYGLFGEFTSSLLEKTILNLEGSLGPSLWSLIDLKKRRKWIKYQLKKLKDISKEDGPLFVFAHFLCPHDPFCFDGKGGPTSDRDVESFSAGYRGQVQFIDREIEKVVEVILKNSKQDPIIIIQGDHGAQFSTKAYNIALGFIDDYPQESIQEAFGILNAYYLPGDGKNKLYDSISPVNSFRVIFNHYLGTDFDLLKDKCFLGPQEGKFVSVKYPAII